MAYVLWGEVMNYSPKDSAWINRDRFVLSNGHACALQYTMLHLTGYNVKLEDLKQFRKIGSKTPGHPESFATDGRYQDGRRFAKWSFECILDALVYSAVNPQLMLALNIHRH